MIKVPLHQEIWLNIRIWAKGNKISDAELASLLRVNIRTLSSYDISAHTLTLDKLSNLSVATDINLSYFIPFTSSQLTKLSTMKGVTPSEESSYDDIRSMDEKTKAIFKKFHWH